MDGRVGFAGDWHGNLPWAKSRLQLFAADGISTVYQVGDFGLWPGQTGRKFLNVINSTCKALSIELVVVLGNHEDYNRVKLMQTNEDGWLFLKDYPAIRFAPRGHVWTDQDGTRFAALGGAGSIDRNLRRPGKSWWSEEELTDEDCGALIRNVLNEGWPRVDVMLTHDAPAGLRRLGVQPSPVWLTPEVQQYCEAQRIRLRTAMDVVVPRSLVHGHWHASIRDGWEGLSSTGADYRCQVFGLPEDGVLDNAITARPAPGLGLTEVADLRVGAP